MPAPSWASYGTGAGSAYPGLWSGIVRAFCPTLGATGTTLEDLSGNNADGTFAGGMDSGDWIDDGGGYHSIDINNNGYVDCGAFPGALTDMTVSMWVLNRSAVAGARFLDNEYGSGFWMGGNGSITSVGGGVRASSSPYGAYGTIGNQVWTHLVLTRVSATGVCTLYVNGSSADTYTGGTGATTTTQPLRLGISVTGNLFGNCKLDDILIHSRVLSAGEISTLATRRAIIFEPAAGGGGSSINGRLNAVNLSVNLSTTLSVGG